ncbi:MAG TPA: LLM class flavin-dependent oxidoreductase [Myxococcota bacterium]|nr:LLM class flavin-dependent oxidoreductase [Myxococcota bacterium]
MKVRIGLGTAGFAFDAARDFFAFAERCEAAGVDSLWQSDRLIGADPQLEPMAAMAALAGATSRIKFGMNAVVVSHRDPLVLAKECATIDFLSNGRLLPVFGVGFEGDPTWRATGRDPAVRGRRADESLALMSRLWAGEEVTFEGVHFRWEGAQIAPLPVQQPLPLWIGGHSPAAIRRTARLGTGWLGGLMPPEQIGPVIRAIRDELGVTGRAIDADHYGATVPFRFGSADDPIVQRFAGAVRARDAADAGGEPPLFVGKPGELIERLRRAVAAGASKFVLIPLARGTREVFAQLDRLVAEVIPVVETS